MCVCVHWSNLKRRLVTEVDAPTEHIHVIKKRFNIRLDIKSTNNTCRMKMLWSDVCKNRVCACVTKWNRISDFRLYNITSLLLLPFSTQVRNESILFFLSIDVWVAWFLLLKIFCVFFGGGGRDKISMISLLVFNIKDVYSKCTYMFGP